MAVWNLWHGCSKISAGCLNCYVYRGDRGHNKADSFIVHKNQEFDLPIRKNRDGSYKLNCAPDEPVFTCMTSDFFVSDADCWRDEAWAMIKRRSDLHFFIITKRIHRFNETKPSDWGSGYDNVTVCCTAENQQMADYRLELFDSLPIKHKLIASEPMLERIDYRDHLQWVDSLTVGGESGNEARVCDYEWILDARRQCVEAGIGFWFKQTGANFRKDGRIYRIPRNMQHSQARKADINITKKQAE